MKTPSYIWCLIPVYNHSETIKKVVKSTLKKCKNVVVVDDGSTDAKIADLLADTGIKVITHEKNLGKGAALRTGAEYVNKKAGKYIITLDADGQHNPDDIEQFVPHLSKKADSIIIGNRKFDSENVPERSKFGRNFSNFWINFETGCEVRDSQSGFRAYPTDLLLSDKFCSNHYAFETEILVRGAWSGLKIINVDISVFYPERKKRITHFRPFMDNLRISLLHSRLTGEKILSYFSRKKKIKSKSKKKSVRPLSKWIFLTFAVLFTFILIMLLFTPRFALWKGIEAHIGYTNPEINRAADTLKQLDNPFVKIENPSNKIIQGRLFFPLLAYYLNINPIIYLTLPYIGLFSVLFLVGKIFLNNLPNRRQVIAGMLLISTSSWFFVSSGWLAYFDSWYILGLLLVVFIDSKYVLAISCLLTPWVDERFILALPLCIILRAENRDILRKDKIKFFLMELAVCTFSISPFIIIRLSSLISSNSTNSYSFLFNQILSGNHFSKNPLTYIEGVWYGLRSSLFYVLLFLILSFSKGKIIKNIFITSAVLLTFLVSIFIAGDISRSASIMIPAAVMGLIYTFQNWKKTSEYILWLLLLITLSTPAYHIVSKFKIRIGNIYDEIQRLYDPPYYLTAKWNNTIGFNYFKKGDLGKALAHFNTAIKISPELSDSYYFRAIVLEKIGENELANEDLEKALTLKPEKWQNEGKTKKLLDKINSKNK